MLHQAMHPQVQIYTSMGNTSSFATSSQAMPRMYCDFLPPFQDVACPLLQQYYGMWAFPVVEN